MPCGGHRASRYRILSCDLFFVFDVTQAARQEIAMIKVVAPHMAQRVVDRAMQVSNNDGCMHFEKHCGSLTN